MLDTITLPFVGSRLGNEGVKQSLFGWIFGQNSDVNNARFVAKSVFSETSLANEKDAQIYAPEENNKDYEPE